jgi:hypothetical protein
MMMLPLLSLLESSVFSQKMEEWEWECMLELDCGLGMQRTCICNILISGGLYALRKLQCLNL